MVSDLLSSEILPGAGVPVELLGPIKKTNKQTKQKPSAGAGERSRKDNREEQRLCSLSTVSSAFPKISITTCPCGKWGSPG